MESERRPKDSKVQRELEHVKNHLTQTEAVLNGAQTGAAFDAQRLTEILGRFRHEMECW